MEVRDSGSLLERIAWCGFTASVEAVVVEEVGTWGGFNASVGIFIADVGDN